VPAIIGRNFNIVIVERSTARARARARFVRPGTPDENAAIISVYAGKECDL